VNKAQNVRMMTIKMPADAYAKLAEWAADNVSSMNAELVRAVRDRVEREQAERDQAVR
jgi:hypothetical protein